MQKGQPLCEVSSRWDTAAFCDITAQASTSSSVLGLSMPSLESKVTLAGSLNNKPAGLQTVHLVPFQGLQVLQGATAACHKVESK